MLYEVITARSFARVACDGSAARDCAWIASADTVRVYDGRRNRLRARSSATDHTAFAGHVPAVSQTEIIFIPTHCEQPAPDHK